MFLKGELDYREYPERKSTFLHLTRSEMEELEALGQELEQLEWESEA